MPTARTPHAQRLATGAGHSPWAIYAIRVSLRSGYGHRTAWSASSNALVVPVRAPASSVGDSAVGFFLRLRVSLRAARPSPRGERVVKHTHVTSGNSSSCRRVLFRDPICLPRLPAATLEVQSDTSPAAPTPDRMSILGSAVLFPAMPRAKLHGHARGFRNTPTGAAHAHSRPRPCR